MIRLEPVTGWKGRRDFFDLPRRVYRDMPQHRATEEDIVRMLVDGPTAYHSHASVAPFLILDGRELLGRLALIQDRRQPGWVQVAFYEALPGVNGLLNPLLLKARALYPGCQHIVVGLHGHLNYGAGFLVEPHDKPPVFGLPYTPAYYLDTFASLRRRDMVSFRFDNQSFYRLQEQIGPTLQLGGITIRDMDRRQLDREVDIYTWLNNACFQRHPYWADRSGPEDFELFHPFRFLMKDENLIFAEEDGQPVGFLLWYPDFNELVGPGQALGPVQALRYHLRNPIKTVRLTEIAVHPACRNRGVVPGMMMQMIRSVQAGGYESCEGGFIFEDNKDSMSMTLRYLAKAFGRELTPSRRYCVFEGEL
ncbi:MAG: GNAT family N-acetyltransferase [Pseudomonadota bacterium]